MRLELQTLVAAHLSSGPQARSLETLDPFDRNQFADPKSAPQRPDGSCRLVRANPQSKVRPSLLASIQPAG